MYYWAQRSSSGVIPPGHSGIYPRRMGWRLGWLDDAVLNMLTTLQERMEESGASEEEQLEKIKQAFETALDLIVPDIATHWESDADEYLEEEREFDRGFTERLRSDYGRGLDLMRLVVAITSDLGNSHEPLEGRDPNTTFVLRSLHARACRVTLEVHALIGSGFPKGALARARTIHEISVVASVLSEFEDSVSDLAKRFLDHERVLNHKDAVLYQDRAERLGYEPFSDEQMASMKVARDEVTQAHGTDFASDCGWARPLFNHRPKFSDLEELVEQSNMRGHYRWMSREVHSDARGLRLNHMQRDGALVFLAGRTNLGLTDPASCALRSLNIVTLALIARDPSAQASGLVLCQSLMLLIEKAERALAEGDRRVRDREAVIRSAADGVAEAIPADPPPTPS